MVTTHVGPRAPRVRPRNILVMAPTGAGHLCFTERAEGPMSEARFLVLEDDPPIARRLARLVRAHGVPVVAGSVREAISALDEGGPLSGLILDVGLPDGSGLDVLAHDRKTHPTTPALVLTGDTERETINAAYSLGAAYLVKPVELKAIERFLARAIETGFVARLNRVVQAWMSAISSRRPGPMCCSEQRWGTSVTPLLVGATPPSPRSSTRSRTSSAARRTYHGTQPWLACFARSLARPERRKHSREIGGIGYYETPWPFEAIDKRESRGGMLYRSDPMVLRDASSAA